jgi:hypothetical protein
MPAAKDSYVASFEADKTPETLNTEQITVLVLAKWIRAFYESK